MSRDIKLPLSCFDLRATGSLFRSRMRESGEATEHADENQRARFSRE
jgi:hypothetical protein